MALRGRRINNFVELWCLVASGGYKFWVSWISFQKSNISWPQQPPTGKALKFNLIFHDSTKINFVSKHQNKAEFENLVNSEVLSSDFQALEPLQPQWPRQPQQPQWPQWPQQPHFIKKFTDPDGSMIPGTKMTNTGPFLWNGSSKIQFFTDSSTFSVRGCWGQPMLLFWKLIHETQNL